MSSNVPNFFGLPSSSGGGGTGSGGMIDYYKVLPSYFLFKQVEQFVNRVDIRSVFDPSDLTIMSHTVDCFRRMKYELSMTMENKLFQAFFVCLLTRFFQKQDEDTLHEIVLLIFDANADRRLPNHTLTLFRSFICRRISSFIAEQKAIKYAEEFAELLASQLIEFENECTKSPDDETFYNDQAFYRDLKETIVEHFDNQNFHIFAEILKNADLILENEDEGEFLGKLAQFKRKSVQHDTLLTEITINSSKLTRRSQAAQSLDDELLRAAGRHFLERSSAFAELTNMENQAPRTPSSAAARRSGFVAPSTDFDDFEAAIELQAAVQRSASKSASKSKMLNSQQAMQLVAAGEDDAVQEPPRQKTPHKSPVKRKEAGAGKTRKKLYQDDNPLLHSDASSVNDDDDELDFDQSPGKVLLAKKKPLAKLVSGLGKKPAKEAVAAEDSFPNVDFGGEDAIEDDGSRPTTSKNAALKQSKITIQRSTPLKFVESVGKKSLVEQMAERRPIPTTPKLQLRTKGAVDSSSDSSDDDGGQEEDKENRSASKASAGGRKSRGKAEESGEESENVASFSKSPKKVLGKAKKRKPWSEMETTFLVAGIATYGLGSWTRILKEYPTKFNDRSSMDLRDKYRNLEKQNNLKRFEKLAKILLEKLEAREKARQPQEDA